ncbi:CRM-domain containing factor CFM9, mitochondrial isoform X4 [Manihot esculenta]|nr:CRM-domain containing factor CFM9, mitochondrial isoform X4 [Manihot esculenta]XP_021609820.1 CRM-domain containing factor CFM9, mitochondrial isoform X4 [Manihot esculenta]XP_043811770.1 CRM-domain containing factor CFM9, mitochondrial isoform X4 [Manihot esculenta]
MHEVDPPKKEKWQTKKRLKMKRKIEKQKRKEANKRDPRSLTVKRKKQKFANAEERIKYKLERAKIKEALLIERLKRYEVPKVQGPEVKPHDLTGEERFFMKKMAQKKSNYVPIGRRGVFGGIILNMHMHWKKHETVKVICKNCKPGQVQEYAQEIARLSGGIPIHFIGDDTVVFYRGKDYVQPEVMSPIDTLSKKRIIIDGVGVEDIKSGQVLLILLSWNSQVKHHQVLLLVYCHHLALEKSKYEQSLETVRHFIAVAEKELELYYRHIALYGDPNNRNPLSILDCPTNYLKESQNPEKQTDALSCDEVSTGDSETEVNWDTEEIEDDYLLSTSESDSLGSSTDWDTEEREEGISLMTEMRSSTRLGASCEFENKFETEKEDYSSERNCGYKSF